MTHEILDTMGHGHQVFTGNVQETFRSLPLPIRMREAAKVLREADQRCHPNYHAGNEYAWYPKELESASHRFEMEDKEAEDRAKAEQDAIAEELALSLFLCALRIQRLETGCWAFQDGITRLKYLDEARRLIEQGWRKGGSDE